MHGTSLSKLPCTYVPVPFGYVCLSGPFLLCPFQFRLTQNIHFTFTARESLNKLTLFLTALIGAVYSTPSSNNTTAISANINVLG